MKSLFFISILLIYLTTIGLSHESPIEHHDPNGNHIPIDDRHRFTEEFGTMRSQVIGDGSFRLLSAGINALGTFSLIRYVSGTSTYFDVTVQGFDGQATNLSEPVSLVGTSDYSFFSCNELNVFSKRYGCKMTLVCLR